MHIIVRPSDFQASLYHCHSLKIIHPLKPTSPSIRSKAAESGLNTGRRCVSVIRCSSTIQKSVEHLQMKPLTKPTNTHLKKTSLLWCWCYLWWWWWWWWYFCDGGDGNDGQKTMMMTMINENYDDDDDDDDKNMGSLVGCYFCKIMMLALGANIHVVVHCSSLWWWLKNDTAGKPYQHSKLFMARRVSSTNSQTHKYAICGYISWVSDWSLTMSSMVVSAEATWVTTFWGDFGSRNPRYLTQIRVVRTQRHKHQQNNAWNPHSLGSLPQTIENKHKIKGIFEKSTFSQSATG